MKYLLLFLIIILVIIFFRFFGNIRKKNELKNLIYRRSVFAIKDIDKGEKFTSLNVANFRPFIGVNSNLIFKVLGSKAKKKIKAFSSIKKKMF